MSSWQRAKQHEFTYFTHRKLTLLYLFFNVILLSVQFGMFSIPDDIDSNNKDITALILGSDA